MLLVLCNSEYVLTFVGNKEINECYGDMEPGRFWGHGLDLFGSRDVIGYVTISLGIHGFLLVVH